MSVFAGMMPMLRAQPVGSGSPPPAQTVVDKAWAQLQSAAQPVPDSGLYAGKTGAELTAARAAVAQSYIDKADQLKSFYKDHPDAAQAKPAQRLEALNLMWAAQAGDNAHEGRWQSLVAGLRDDKALPEADRYQLAVMADFLHIQRQRGLSRDERLAAFEQAARGLMAEFPTRPGGYESLLGVARSAPAEKGRALAAELLATPASAAVKLAARELADRYDLVGQPAGPLLADAGAKVELKPGVATVVYAWATWSQGSVDLAKLLQTKAPHVSLVGLCLDTDTEAAKKVGADLAGQQVYDDRGREGALAQALHLSDAGWVYLIDKTGVITDVRLQDHLAMAGNL